MPILEIVYAAMILDAHKLWDTRLGPFRRLAAHGNPPKCKKICSIKSWVDYKKRTYPIIQHLKRSFFWNSHHTSSISLNQSHFPTSSVSPAPGTTKEASENFRSIPYMALCCPGPRRPLPRCRTKVTDFFLHNSSKGCAEWPAPLQKGRLAVSTIVCQSAPSYSCKILQQWLKNVQNSLNSCDVFFSKPQQGLSRNLVRDLWSRLGRKYQRNGSFPMDFVQLSHMFHFTHFAQPSSRWLQNPREKIRPKNSRYRGHRGGRIRRIQAIPISTETCKFVAFRVVQLRWLQTPPKGTRTNGMLQFCLVTALNIDI